MARTLAEIILTMDEAQAAQSELAGLNSTSQTSIYKLWKYIVALSIYLLETLMDLKKTEIENLIIINPPHTAEWVRQRAFEFQYDAGTPQVMTLINGVPQYPVVSEALRIITVCVIRFSTSRILNIIVAKSDPPEALTAPELAAIQAYYTDGGTSSDLAVGIGIAGIAHSLETYDTDYVWLEAEIFYDGLYTATIEADVIAAINAYLSALGIDGALKTTKLVDAICAVTGVHDIEITGLAIRANGTAFGARTYLIQASAILLIEEDAVAGYANTEIEVGELITDTLTFTVG